jgi:5'-nucleotidase
MTAASAERTLAGRRILLSNDDGIGAHGLVVLERIARALSDDVWVVAPAIERSGAGHSLTLHEPLRPVKVGEKRYTVSGTPTDAVMVAINHLMKDSPPDLVLSGVNMGGNLGEDVHYSGTVAAAMEGTLLGVPAIALSQQLSDLERVPWATAERYGPDLIRRIWTLGWDRDVLININFPDCAPDAVKGVVPARQGKHKVGDDLIFRHDPRGRPINFPDCAPDAVKGVVPARQGKHKVGDDLIFRHDPRGRPYLWIGMRRASDRSPEGTDLKVVDNGYISVTPLNVDLTHAATLEALTKEFS